MQHASYSLAKLNGSEKKRQGSGDKLQQMVYKGKSLQNKGGGTL